MPYIPAPPRAKFLDRVFHAARWFSLTLIGLGVFLHFPHIYTGPYEIMTPMAYASGALMFISSLGGLVGVLSDHYQIEWGAIWFSIGGVVLLVGLSWAWAGTQNIAALIVVLLSLYALFSLLQRWNQLETIAAKDREISKMRK